MVFTTISTDEFDMIWILWLIEPVDLSASSEYASWSRHRHGEIQFFMPVLFVKMPVISIHWESLP